MTVVGEHRIALSGAKADILPFRDMDWNSALELAEDLARSPSGRSAISFLGVRLMARCLFDPLTRRRVARHLLLPSGSIAAGMIFRLLPGRRAPTRYSASTFVPALLTYAQDRLRIAVAGDTAESMETLRARLQRHAPWHDVVSASAGGECDILIVGDRYGPAGGKARYPAANLTIFVGGDLRGFAGARA